MAETNPIRVLYMEDDAALARLVRHKLQRAGYDVELAGDGAEGLAKYAAGKHDVLVVDNSMPVRNGLEVIRELAAAGDMPPMVMVTASDDAALAVEAMKLGANDYLIKDSQGKYIDRLPVVLAQARDKHRVACQQRLASAANRDSRAILSSLYDLSPDAIVLVDEEGVFLDCNRTTLALIRGDSREQVVGKTPVDFLAALQPDGREAAAWTAMNLALARERQTHACEALCRRRDGSEFPADCLLGLVEVSGRPAFQVVVRDISERKKVERLSRLNEQRMDALLRLNQMIEPTLQEITDFALEEGVRLTGSTIGYLAFLNEDETVMTMHSWSKSAMQECAIVDKPIIYPVADTGLWGEAVRQRKPVIANDYPAPNPLKRGHPQGHVKVLRHMNVPIFDGERIVAVAGVGNKTEEYDENDVRQLTLLMQGMWRNIQRQRTDEELTQYREHLEELVAERTRRLSQLFKEINCLHAISELVRDASLAEAETLRRAVDLIPLGWRAPEHTCARIVLDGRAFATGNFQETVWKLGAPIMVMGQLAGAVEVCRLEGTLAEGEEPFLAEERALVNDIASRLGHLIERNRADAEVKRLKQQIEFVLGASKTGLDIIDARYNVRYIDPARQRLYGEYRGHKCYEYLYGRDAPCSECVLCKAIEAGTTLVVERILPRENNRPVQSTVIPYQDESGEWLVAEVKVDISERKRMEADLAQSQKMESIGQLAAGIAHEINTPIQYVGDNARFLQDAFGQFDGLLESLEGLCRIAKDGNAAEGLVGRLETVIREADVEYLRDEIPKAVQQSLEGVDRVAHIVRAMKEFSHPNRGQKQPVDLNRAIETTLTISRNEWKYVADMQTDLDPALPPVPCLANDFNQVILNVVVNAAHAIAPVIGNGAQGKGTIAVSTRREGEWAEIRIRDTGTGIPAEIRQKIFDPFFTTKEVGKGTGQGLSIAHYIVVKKHGGTITFETETGRGTTFIIRLPLHDSAAAPQDSQPETLETAAP
jgi:PAS domain S-box-containing protein